MDEKQKYICLKCGEVPENEIEQGIIGGDDLNRDKEEKLPYLKHKKCGSAVKVSQVEDKKDLPLTEETLKELKDLVEKLEKERADYLDGWQRAKADFINYKKEEARRGQLFVQFANEAIIGELLSVLDSFDIALNSLPQEEKQKPIAKGFYLIKGQLETILKRWGVEAIEARGKKFDPNFHEAVEKVKAQSGQESGIILEELERGFMLNGKVLRPAKVKISE